MSELSIPRTRSDLDIMHLHIISFSSLKLSLCWPWKKIKNKSNFVLCVVVNGLGLIPGVVGRFDSSNGFRVPQIGWNALQITKDSEILDDVGDHHVYFVHSYRAMPVCLPSSSSPSLLKFPLLIWIAVHDDYTCSKFRAVWWPSLFICPQSNDNKEWVSSTCNYGDNFIASVRRGNVHAVQFHPEKSGGKTSFALSFSSFIIVSW